MGTCRPTEHAWWCYVLNNPKTNCAFIWVAFVGRSQLFLPNTSTFYVLASMLNYLGITASCILYVLTEFIDILSGTLRTLFQRTVERNWKFCIKNKFKQNPNKNSPWIMFLKYKISLSIYEHTERDWRNIVLFICLFITIPLTFVLCYLSPSLCTY